MKSQNVIVFRGETYALRPAKKDWLSARKLSSGIAAIREEAGIQQKIVATEMGLSQSALSLIESGGKAPPKNFERNYRSTIKRLQKR